jgi:hypothetical protein
MPNALMQPPQAAGPAATPSAAPAPTHAQTVAALRHFGAIAQKLQGALADPDAGKANMKSKVIDGMTELVGSRMMSPAEAVQVLATFPERPFDQRAWLANHLNQTLQARDMVLTHHATAFAGQGPQPMAREDDHQADIRSMLQSHYGQT